MSKLSNTEAPTITEQTANETNAGENTAEGSNAQDSDETAKDGQNGDSEKAPADRHYTLDEILKSDPAIKADYDRKMQAAIAKHDARLTPKVAGNGAQQTVGNAVNNTAEQKKEEGKAEEKLNIDELIDQRVEERITEERFGNRLNALLDQAGIVDKQGYLSHIDIDNLYEHYDPKKDSIPGYEDIETEMRNEYPFYFGTKAGGMEHGTFGANKPASLKDALVQKYN